MVRWDHNFGEKALLMIRYLGEDQSLDGINGQLWGDDNFPSVNSDWTFGAHNSVIKLTSTLSPRLVNDFQFGYTNNRIVFATGKSSDPTLASRDGFTYTELFPQTSGSFPSMGGVESFGSIQHTAPFFNREDLFQFKDDIAYTFGSHNLKMGFFGGRSHKREPANGGEDDTAGSIEFDSFQDLLFGNLTTYQEAQTLNEVPDRWRDVAVYVQDTWKLRPGFTLDIGLRWQFLGQVFSAHDNIANFFPNLYDASRCSSGALNEDGLVDPGLMRRAERNRDAEFARRSEPFAGPKPLWRLGAAPGVRLGRAVESQADLPRRRWCFPRPRRDFADQRAGTATSEQPHRHAEQRQLLAAGRRRPFAVQSGNAAAPSAVAGARPRLFQPPKLPVQFAESSIR